MGWDGGNELERAAQACRKTDGANIGVILFATRFRLHLPQGEHLVAGHQKSSVRIL